MLTKPSQVEQHELKMDAKIDMLQQTQLLGHSTYSQEQKSNSESSTLPASVAPSDTEMQSQSESSSAGVSPFWPTLSTKVPNMMVQESSRSETTSRSPSPLAMRTGQSTFQSSSNHNDQDIAPIPLEDANFGRTMNVDQHEEQTSSSAPSSDEVEETESDSSDKLAPQRKYVKQAPEHPLIKARATTSTIPTESSSGNLADLEELEQEMDELSLWGPSDDSIIILPDRKARKKAVQSGGGDVEYVPKGGEVDTAPKKKRCVVI